MYILEMGNEYGILVRKLKLSKYFEDMYVDWIRVLK
jgi:hypothetical protein